MHACDVTKKTGQEIQLLQVKKNPKEKKEKHSAASGKKNPKETTAGGQSGIRDRAFIQRAGEGMTLGTK